MKPDQDEHCTECDYVYSTELDMALPYEAYSKLFKKHPTSTTCSRDMCILSLAVRIGTGICHDEEDFHEFVKGQYDAKGFLEDPADE